MAVALDHEWQGGQEGIKFSCQSFALRCPSLLKLGIRGRTDAEYGSCVILRQNMCERARSADARTSALFRRGGRETRLPLGSSDENIEPFEGMERQSSFTEDIAAPDKNVVCP